MIDWQAARRLVADWQAAGEKVVFTNGCFDLIHAGHIEILSQARALGDRLIVGLNSDHSVNELKGAGRPVITQDDRVKILSALRPVDLVVIFTEPTPAELIAVLRPDILVKGREYRLEDIAGADTVLASGGEVRRLELVTGRSTSAIIRKIRGQERDEIA